MKKFLKQFFCDHVYKVIREEHIRDDRIREGYNVLHIPYYATYKVMAVFQKCLACEKERIIERRDFKI